jgi:tetratricopeptide (TPR) repeat protein
MDRNTDIERAIRQHDAAAIVHLMIDPVDSSPKSGFRTEEYLWDYKSDCPFLGKEHANAWAHLAKDVLAFHNQKGGLIFFGISNSYKFTGATQFLDSKQINDQLRRYLGDRIWVEYHREHIKSNQRYLGLLLIPPRGATLERFKADSPLTNGANLFRAGDSAIREGDSSRVLRKHEVDQYSIKVSVPTIDEPYAINEEHFRILSPDYQHFIERPKYSQALDNALKAKRIAVVSVIGIGGIGKTALATWGVLQSHEKKQFDFIVSITAKDRELTSAGIQALAPNLTSFESLLDSILEVLGFPEQLHDSIEEKEKHVKVLLDEGNGLLFVDNLETVDDSRVLSFLDDLPMGTRAIVTSRRSVVRVSVYPVDVDPFSEDEVTRFVDTLRSLPGYAYVQDMTVAEKKRVGVACDGIPLGIKWMLGRASSPAEALHFAEAVSKSGRRGEELLEFCFRRVFDAMPEAEKAVLQVLALFQRPLPTEAILVGAGIAQSKVLDGTDSLIKDSVIQRLFDQDRNDYCYALLPMARNFIYGEVRKKTELEKAIRQRLSDWFEARDARDPDERLVIRELRQGKAGSESALVDLAKAAERRGDLDAARGLYEQALQRNPTSWKAARSFAEFHRHKLNNLAAAIRLYEQAAANAPRRGSDRALIFREWGMLLRDSGDPDATDMAIEKFEVALAETPNDPVATHALAHMLDRTGAHARVITLLEPLIEHQSLLTRRKTYPLLLTAYERMGEMLKAANLRVRMKEE